MILMVITTTKVIAPIAVVILVMIMRIVMATINVISRHNQLHKKHVAGFRSKSLHKL